MGEVPIQMTIEINYLKQVYHHAVLCWFQVFDISLHALLVKQWNVPNIKINTGR